MERDERSFDEFTRARLPHLLMLARTLTCDEREAETLVEDSLAPVLDRWDESSPYTAEEEVRRALVRAALRRTPAPAATEEPVWTALANLPARERAALALHLHEDLVDEQVAEILDCSTASARDAVERAIAAVDVVATREAVLEPVPVDESVLPEVRARAARRRRRRTRLTAVVTVTAAVVLGAVVLLTSGGSGVRDLEYQVQVMSASSADTVWAMTRDKECPGCTVLWKGDGDGGWERVYLFRSPVIQAQLIMAPDGRNGFAWFASDHLLATHDGGKTWVVPDIEIRGSRVEIAFVGTTVYAQITEIDESRLEMSRLGSDDWEEVPLATAFDIGLLPFADDVWVRASENSDVDVVRPLNGEDGGGPVPCRRGNVVSSPRALLASCQGPGGVQVLRSRDGTTWTEFAIVENAAPALYPLSDERVLMRTFTGAALVTADDVTPVHLGFGPRDTIANADFPTERAGFVRSFGGSLAHTDDGGETWKLIS